MNQNKKGSPDNQLSCKICEIYSMSSAEYALHEFTKKHCYNLIRLVKNKPVLKKVKKTEVEKEPAKVNIVTHTGSFAKYGYFVPGEIYAAGRNPKEFNLDYDPYLQKFAENPLKEKTMPAGLNLFLENNSTVLPSTDSAHKKKKKKKSKIKTCQICNVTLLTTPEYEAHMKSPEHILMLKVCGMGVSAHFVKASADLHTTETKEDQKVSKVSTSENGTQDIQNSSSEVVLLNDNVSKVPFNATNEYKTNYFKNDVEEETMLKNPLNEKLFCYTCNIALNTVFQYNEHKQGKRHKSKCRALIKKGMTVPPEERVPGIEMSNSDLSEPIYPKSYLKMIIERQKQCIPPSVEYTGSKSTVSILQLSPKTEPSDCDADLTSFDERQGDNAMPNKIQGEINFPDNSDNASSNEPVEKSNITFQKINFSSAQTTENPASGSNSECTSVFYGSLYNSKSAEFDNIYQEQKSNIIVLNNTELLYCSICDENFQWQSQYDTHLTLENHFKKILCLKDSGKSESEILKLIFADRNVVKPNNLGKLSCSICKITVDTKSEFVQHLSSVVHKYTEKDYKQKRTFEVRHMTPLKDGLYCCKLCKIKLSSLVELCQHFLKAKHKSDQKAKNSSKRTLFQKQRLSQNLKKKHILLRSLKVDKNLGVTKNNVPNAVTQLTGPNSEILESNRQSTKNENVELCEKSEPNRSNLVIKKRQNLFDRSRNFLFRNLNQSDSGAMPPLLPDHTFPSVYSSRFPNHPSCRFSPYPTNVRNAPQFYNSYPPAFGPFRGGPLLGNPFYRASFQRTPWRNFR